MLGSRSFTDTLPEAEIDQATSRDGKRLRDALADAGYAGRPREFLDPARYVGYFEAHIEQGDTLEATGSRIGVVEGIIGNWNYWITVTGEQNHAGTTEMRRRKDAAAALVRLAARIHDRFAEIAGRAPCGRSGASCSIRTRRASCPAAPRCRSSSATPIPRSWRGSSGRSTS